MSQRSDLEERFGAGVCVTCTPGWGVKDSDGDWDLVHVSEEDARTQYLSDVHIVALFAEVNTDERTGEESARLVACKPARCVRCGRERETDFESGEYHLPLDWEWPNAVPAGWPSPATYPATCPECYQKAEAKAAVRAAHPHYSDAFDPDLQVTTEEMIAAIVFDLRSDTVDLDEETCAHLGRAILLAVVSKIAPQLLTKRED